MRVAYAPDRPNYTYSPNNYHLSLSASTYLPTYFSLVLSTSSSGQWNFLNQSIIRSRIKQYSQHYMANSVYYLLNIS